MLSQQSVVTIQNENNQRKKKRLNKYIPGLAYLRFKPKDDWSTQEAQRLYEKTCHPDLEQDRIIYDDCIPRMEVMSPRCVDLVIADPPFGIDFSGREGVYNRDSNFVVDSYQEINGDYGRFTESWMLLMKEVMKPEATAYVFSGWNHLEEILRGARLAGLTTINHLIWKYQFGVFTREKFVTSHYHILLLAKDPEKYYFNKIEHYAEDVWIIKRKYRRGQSKNGNTLPEEVVRKCIEFGSKPGDLVFDPFMGMGTTAVAAKTLWRHCYGFEINGKLEPIVTKRIDDAVLGKEYEPFAVRRQKILEEAKERYRLAYRIYSRERTSVGR